MPVVVREQIWIQHVENANFWSNWGNNWHLKAFYCDCRLMTRACGFERQHLSEHTTGMVLGSNQNEEINYRILLIKYLRDDIA